MTDLAVLGPIERARASARLLAVRAQLSGPDLAPMERIRLSAEGLKLREQLGAAKAAKPVGLPPKPDYAQQMAIAQEQARTKPLAELEQALAAAGAEVDKHRRVMDLGALTPAAVQAMDQYSVAKAAVDFFHENAAWEAAKARPVATASSKPHTVKASEVLTPAGVLKAAAINTKADTAVWYYQGDVKRLAFVAGVTINGEPDKGAEAAALTLARIKAARSRGFRLVNYRAGRLGTVWMLEGDGDVFLTRTGFDQADNPVFDRPAMPEAVPGYESMQAQQKALATAFIAWLDTLPYEQRHNQSVVNRKVGETPVGKWAALSSEPLGLTLAYRHENRNGGIRVVGKDFDALIAELRKIAVMPEIETAPAQENYRDAESKLKGLAARRDPEGLEGLEGQASTGRAPAGGTIGLNGEFYPGGTILPTTTLPKGSSATTSAGTGRQLVEPGVLEEPPLPGAKALFAQVKEFIKIGAGGLEPDATRAVAMIHYLGENGAALVMAYCKAYNNGKRWLLPGETISAAATDITEQAPAAPPPEIIEYVTKGGKGKTLRGIIRTDLTKDEAKAIDPYTWRMNGGYFIREKYLSGDTSAVQAAPAPVVLSAEQEAEKQARDERQAQERKQQALASQVNKLREVAAKAIDDGQGSMNQERKTNTARRAGMAAAAFAQAAMNEAEGLTLNSIADALEVGAAGPLAKLSSRAQLQELKRALSLAKWESDKGLSYAEKQGRGDREANDADLQHVAFPVPLVWSRRYKEAALTIAKKAAKGNSKLIAALTKLGNNAERFRLTDTGDIAITRKAHKVLQSLNDGYTLKDCVEALGKVDRLNRMDITNTAELQDACRALLPHLAARKEESAVAKAERAIIGQKVGIDFFPTPAHVAQRMATLARISKGDRVLEPSAGNGNLADAAAAAGGTVDVIEISSQLRDILTAKGYNVVDHDFMGFTPEAPYDAILMNPPFSKRQDAEHIMHAFGMVKGGGTLVAIAGEGVFFGQDQKAQQFRDWLDSHNAEVEKLEGGTFKDNGLLAQTGANARLIIIRK